MDILNLKLSCNYGQQSAQHFSTVETGTVGLGGSSRDSNTIYSH